MTSCVPGSVHSFDEGRGEGGERAIRPTPERRSTDPNELSRLLSGNVACFSSTLPSLDTSNDAFGCALIKVGRCARVRAQASRMFSKHRHSVFFSPSSMDTQKSLFFFYYSSGFQTQLGSKISIHIVLTCNLIECRNCSTYCSSLGYFHKFQMDNFCRTINRKSLSNLKRINR